MNATTLERFGQAALDALRTVPDGAVAHHRSGETPFTRCGMDEAALAHGDDVMMPDAWWLGVAKDKRCTGCELSLAVFQPE